MPTIDGVEGVWVWVPRATPELVSPGRAPQALLISREDSGWRVVTRGPLLGDVDPASPVEIDGRLEFRIPGWPSPISVVPPGEGGDGLLRIWALTPVAVGESTWVAKRSSLDELDALDAVAPSLPSRDRVELPAQVDIPSTGSAPTPPLGWNSWNLFRDGVDDRAIREMADALVSSGLRDAGYEYVNIDDGWQGHRDADGILHPNEKFPDMAALADYVHSRGLKFGIYSSPGPTTCGGFLGSHGFEREDAEVFAEWGVDLLKYDWCSAYGIYSTRAEMQALYQRMGAALSETGRSIVYSLCQYGLHDVGSWGAQVGASLWRTGGDTCEGDRWTAVEERFDHNGDPELQEPGRWNDPDMMLVGLDGLTEDEARTHMTLWVISGAPIILGHDLRSVEPVAHGILTNPEVLAVDQDPLGIQGRRVVTADSTEIWTKALADGATAVALFNRGTSPARVTVTWEELALPGASVVRDLWSRSHIDADSGSDPEAPGITVELPAHGSALYSVEPLSA